MNGPVLLHKTELYCKKCNAIFIAELIYNVAITVFVAHTKTIRCEACGAGFRKLSFVTNRAALEKRLASEGLKTK